MPRPHPIKYQHGYRVNFWADNKRLERKFPTKREAEAFIDRHWQKIPKPTDSLRVMIAEYIRWSEQDKKKSASWCISLTQMLGVFCNHMTKIGITSATQIKFEQMASFRSMFARSAKRSDATWEKYRQAVSSFLNWANRRDKQIQNPAADEEFKIKVQLNSPETLNPDEIERILKYCDSHDAGRQVPMGTAFRILLYSGLRLGELLGLKWSAVDFDAQGGPTISVGTKTKEARTVPIANKLRPYLEALPRKTVYVLDDGNGGQLHHRKTYYTALQRACATMGIARHSIHSLRHTFIRYLVEAGVDLPLIQKIAGHRDIRTTMRYAQHFDQSRARSAVDKLSF